MPEVLGGRTPMLAPGKPQIDSDGPYSEKRRPSSADQ